MKILLTIILFLNCSSAFAKFKSREELTELYFRARKETPHSEQWFIPKNTLRCGSKTALKKAYHTAINNNGVLDSDYLFHLNCGTRSDMWSIGLVVEAPEKGSNIVKLAYQIRDKNVTTAYFYAPSLINLEQRKKMNIN